MVMEGRACHGRADRTELGRHQVAFPEFLIQYGKFF